MKTVLSLLLLGLALVSAFTETEYQDAFVQWMKAHSRTYSQAEFQNRFAIFKANMDYVTKFNAENTQTQLGLNVFADLTNAEYQRIYLGTHVSAEPEVGPKAEVVPTKRVGANYNATVDWRTANPPIITPIKNQGQCGSCWTFSTTGSTEGAHAQATKKLVSLSEQNLVDCANGEKYPDSDGCNGGLMSEAMQYIINNNGIDTEASYPYTAGDGNWNASNCAFSAANVGATLSSYTNVTSGDESALAAAVNIRPVSVAIDASGEAFQLYKSGIYYSKQCSSTELDHGVLAVGYGVETTSGHHYWIVKNSWGTTWGMNGWIYMSKDRNNNCGIATMASYPSV